MQIKQIKLDDYQAPLATPYSKDKFYFADFQREKDYFSMTILASFTGDYNLQLFNAQTDFNDPVYSTKILTDISYRQLLESVCNNGYLVDFIKIAFETNEQIDQNISVVWIDANGQTCTYPIIMRNSVDTYQHQPLLVHIDLRKAPILLDGNTYLILPMVDKKSIYKIVFQYRKRILKSEHLKLIDKLYK